MNGKGSTTKIWETIDTRLALILVNSSSTHTFPSTQGIGGRQGSLNQPTPGLCFALENAENTVQEDLWDDGAGVIWHDLGKHTE